MPSNSKEYQQAYREKAKGKRAYLTVSMSPDDHREITDHAKAQGFSASTIMREATLQQIRGSQLKSREITQELRQLRFTVASIANNMNQLAKHSNRVKHVADEEAVLRLFRDFDTLMQDLVDNALQSKP